jgi:hypothetical protein
MTQNIFTEVLVAIKRHFALAKINLETKYNHHESSKKEDDFLNA